MFKRLFSAALVFGAAALAPPVADAAIQCAARNVLVEKLEQQFSEHLTGMGLQSPTQLVEIWSSDETGTFTILMTRPDGIACVMATGRNWNKAISPDRDSVAG